MLHSQACHRASLFVSFNDYIDEFPPDQIIVGYGIAVYFFFLLLKLLRMFKCTLYIDHIAREDDFFFALLDFVVVAFIIIYLVLVVLGWGFFVCVWLVL